MADFPQPGEHDYIPDGVHLDLDFEKYILQGLGSTDLVRLWFRKEGWWWTSRWNRRYKRKSSKELLFGSAAHALILEGPEAYDSRFALAPDWTAMEGIFDTVLAAKAWLTEHGFKTTGKPWSDWTKDEWVTACIDGEIEIPWKPVIEARVAKANAGKTLLTPDDDWAVRLLREIMLDPTRADNEDIRKIFGDSSGFPTLAEVSVIHTLPTGIRRRWRIDRMFPSCDLDLKTLGNWQGRDLKFHVGDEIAKKGYDIQRADYKRGRQIAMAYIEAGKIYGGTPEQVAWLETWPALYPKWDWKWLFFQKPDSSHGQAPVLFPLHDDDGSTIEEAGAKKADVAYNRFLTYRARWGMDRPWARVEPQHFTDESYGAERAVMFPHWIDNIEDPTEAEAWGQPEAAA